MSLIYPSIVELDDFKDKLLQEKFSYLPPLDGSWARDMHDMFEVVQILPKCDEVFEVATAHIFFKIAKNHRRFDGNKRSAICCVLFFSMLNHRGCIFSSPEIEAQALCVASSQGNTEQQFIPTLSNFFLEKTVEMW